MLLHLYPVLNMRTAFKLHDTMLRYCIISVSDEDPGGRNIVLQFTLLLRLLNNIPVSTGRCCAVTLVSCSWELHFYCMTPCYKGILLQSPHQDIYITSSFDIFVYPLSFFCVCPECSPQVHPLCKPLSQLLQVPHAIQLWCKENAWTVACRT